MNKMQQQQQQQQVGPPSMPLNLVSTEQIQRYLDENKNLIMAILENQNLGKMAECAQYQAILQRNLMYLAAIADAQPPPPGSSTPPSSQLPTNSVAPQGNSSSAVLTHQASPLQQQQPIGKLPFQLNAVRSSQEQQQQNQLLQQFQQQQHLQAQFGANNGLHLLMQHGGLGSHPGGALATSGGDGQGNSGLFHVEGRE